MCCTSSAGAAGCSTRPLPSPPDSEGLELARIELELELLELELELLELELELLELELGTRARARGWPVGAARA